MHFNRFSRSGSSAELQNPSAELGRAPKSFGRASKSFKNLKIPQKFSKFLEILENLPRPAEDPSPDSPEHAKISRDDETRHKNQFFEKMKNTWVGVFGAL